MNEYERENVRRRRRNGDLCDLASYVARWSENAWRIALVLHCAKHGTTAHTEELATPTAIDAVELMRWFSERQLEILHQGRREKHQKRLSALLAVLAEARGQITVQNSSNLPSCFPILLRLKIGKDRWGGRRFGLLKSDELLIATRRYEKYLTTYLNPCSINFPPVPKVPKLPKVRI
jgi:hypothetical protein